MCGGVIFPYKKEYREALAEYYSPAEIDEFERTGQVRSLYWQRGDPVLPVRVGDNHGEAGGTGDAGDTGDGEGKGHGNAKGKGKGSDQADGAQSDDMLLRWGNRDKDAPFPQTGWARIDSIESGKWSYLRPEPVLIPVTHGVEKGKWFEIENGILGVMVHRGDESRVYMLTDEATPQYRTTTNHERMPVLQEQTEFHWLTSDPSGMDSAQ